MVKKDLLSIKYKGIQWIATDVEYVPNDDNICSDEALWGSLYLAADEYKQDLTDLISFTTGQRIGDLLCDYFRDEHAG